MRTELEALLLYAAPRELLIAEPLSSATSKMLGAFVSASAGVRAETVQRDTYRDGGARAAVVAFYGEEGAPHSALCSFLLLLSAYCWPRLPAPFRAQVQQPTKPMRYAKYDVNELSWRRSCQRADAAA